MRTLTSDSSYTRIQVPGQPGIRFRDLPLEVGRSRLRIYTASAVDVLSRPGLSESPYWCVAWPAGLALARHLGNLDLRGRKVLEVGCGVGVAALAAALAGADVVATDNIPEALRVTAMNARRNGLRLSVAAADWRHWPLRGKFDLVIGSDVTYLPESYPALLDTLDAALKPGGTALITDPHRGSTSAFLSAATARGWAVASSELAVEGPQAVRLHHLGRAFERLTL